MADLPTTAPATPSTQPAAPAGPESGISAAMKHLDAGVASIEAGNPPAAPTPPATPPSTPPATPPATPATPPVVPPVPPEEDAAWEKAPKSLRNMFFKTKREKQETEARVAEYEKKIKDLEAKPVQSAADLKKIADAEARIADLEGSLTEREKLIAQNDFRNSEAFKREWIEKGTKAYGRAVAYVKQLKVRTEDADGNVAERPATEQDFLALRSLRPGEMEAKANEMFGAAAARVVGHISAIEEIENGANEAIQNAHKSAEESRKAAQKAQEEQTGEYKTHAEKAIEELTTKHAMFFAPDPANPEASTALENGFKYVDAASKNVANMTVKERAETTAIIRGLAAAAPRLMVEKKQLTAKVAALETELAKYRKSDPGSVTPQRAAATTPPAVDAGGLKGMAKQFDALK